jgi:hypothetical protein
MLDDQLAYLYSHVVSGYGRPTEGAYQRYADLVEATDPLLARIEAVLGEPLANFNRTLAEAGVGAVLVPAPREGG